MKNSKGFILPSFQLYEYLTAAIGVLAVVGYVYWKISSLEADNALLEQNAKVLEQSISQITDINRNNKKTMDKIEADRIEAEKKLAALKLKSKQDTVELAGLRKKVETLNDGAAAPVLLETIKDIQGKYK